jgi:hypothetical protein
MARHQDLVVVRFHGGFLDGQIASSDEPLTGGIHDYWHPRRLYDVTLGEVGAFMSGVSPEGLDSMKKPTDTAPTVVLHHRYRVTTSRVDAGVLTIDVNYEYDSGETTA